MKRIKKILWAPALVLCIAALSNHATPFSLQQQHTTTVNHDTDAFRTGTDILFEKYCNARYGYCIDYPAAFLHPQPESTNGDGRVFTNKEGKNTLTVFGRNNAGPESGIISLEQQYQEDLHELKEKAGDHTRVITYHKLGKTFFVISGFDGNEIFYQKTIIKKDAFAYAVLQYDQSGKATFDRVSERIFTSFR